jgi:hypothetical protein
LIQNGVDDLPKVALGEYSTKSNLGAVYVASQPLVACGDISTRSAWIMPYSRHRSKRGNLRLRIPDYDGNNGLLHPNCRCRMASGHVRMRLFGTRSETRAMSPGWPKRVEVDGSHEPLDVAGVMVSAGDLLDPRPMLQKHVHHVQRVALAVITVDRGTIEV